MVQGGQRQEQQEQQRHGAGASSGRNNGVPSEEGGAQETVSLSDVRLQGGAGWGRGRRAREGLAEPRWEGRIEACSYVGQLHEADGNHGANHPRLNRHIDSQNQGGEPYVRLHSVRGLHDGATAYIDTTSFISTGGTGLLDCPVLVPFSAAAGACWLIRQPEKRRKTRKVEEQHTALSRDRNTITTKKTRTRKTNLLCHSEGPQNGARSADADCVKQRSDAVEKIKTDCRLLQVE